MFGAQDLRIGRRLLVHAGLPEETVIVHGGFGRTRHAQVLGAHAPGNSAGAYWAARA